ncbi:hypothetical protein [Chryseobacterium turcicum]|uniref:Uncharacterized protein n=1 Tax=Chryseobacterium turcicum TaxID=2898076 RepID=A0A9Q3V667_9FLAO|nr:hypothetical protein [Chryseobacterium turcicum]MCD1118523.1 hypothetical protein [Chryseobacterium turcicum]
MEKIFLLSSVLMALFVNTQTPTYVPSSGLVAWWGFSGNSNNNNNLTVTSVTLTGDSTGTTLF